MATDNRKIQLGIEVADNTKAGLDSAKQNIRDTARVMEQEGSKASKGLDGIGQAAEGASKRTEAATKSLIAQIQRVTAETQAGARGTEEYFKSIAQQRGIDQSALAPYLQQLTAARAAQDAAARSMDNLGMTAKQTTAALRQVPAQFTDIVVSLQGGQAPLTVLLQQGGQLKDVFGGVGAAAQALGRYIATLITPVNVLAAGVATLAVAYELGRRESEAFAKGLILTGNAAGTTVGQLNQAAVAIDAIVGTQGKAAESLNAFVAAGVKGASSLTEFTTAAIRFERVTGQAVADTAKQFADLARDPLQATLKLNEGMNFLTASTYEQIKALVEAGRETEAANVAQKAFADTLNERATQIEGNLGLLERGWKSVTSAIKEAWDAIKGIGREDGLQQQLNTAQVELERLLQNQAGARTDNRGRYQPLIDAARAQIESLKEQIRLETRAADAQRERAELVKLKAGFDKEGVAFLAKEEKMRRELAKVEIEGQRLLNAGLITEQQLRERIQNIRDKYADKPTASRGGQSSESKELKERADLLSKLMGVNSDYVESLGRIQKMREQGVITEAQSIELLNELITKQPMAAKLIKEQADAEKERQKVLDELAKQQEKQLDAVWKSADATTQQAVAQEQANATFGSSKIALAELTLAELEQQRVALEQTENVIPGYIQALEARIAAQKRLVAALKEGEVKEASDKAAKDSSREWERTARKIEDTLTDALMRGFESGKDFARVLRDTVVNMFKTMVLRPVVQFVVGGITGALGLPSVANAAQGANSLASVGSTLSNLWSGGMNFLNGSSISASTAGYWQRGADWLSTSSNNTLAGAGDWMSANPQVGSYLGMAGNAFAGYGIQKGISGGYQVGNGKVVDALTIAASAYFGPIAGAVAGVFNRAFGRKAPVTTGQGIEGTFSTDGASVRGFQEWFSKGGWFRSDKRGVNYSAVSTELDDFLDQSLRQVTMATKMYADVLGLNANAVNGITQSVRINLKDLTAEQQQEAVIKALGGFGDRLAEQLLGTFETYSVEVGSRWSRRTEMRTRWVPGEFVREGENAGEALARLAESLNAVNRVFKTLNTTLLDTSLIGGDAASKLLEGFGGADAFNALTNAYFQAFYTEAERNGILLGQLSEAFKQLGLELPDTRQQFRDLVEAQNLYTTAGRETYTALLQLAPAFDALTPKIDTLAGQLGKLAGQIVNETVSIIDDQINASRSAADEARRTAEAYADAARSLRETGEALFGSALAGAQSVRFLEAQYTRDLRQARGGDLDALDRLSGSAADYLEAYRSTAQTQLDYTLTAAMLRVQLANTADNADRRATGQENLAKLLDINTAMLEVLRESLLSGDLTREELQKQLDALKFIGDAIEDNKKLAAEGLDINAIVAEATGGSQTLLSDVLRQLQKTPSGTKDLIEAIVDGNDLVAGQVSDLIAVLTRQAKAEADLQKQRDDRLKDQFKDLVTDGKGLRSSERKAESKEIKEARDLVASFIRFENVREGLNVSAPSNIAALNAYYMTAPDALQKLSAISDKDVLDFAKRLSEASTSGLRGGLSSTSRFLREAGEFKTAATAENEIENSIKSIYNELKALQKERPDLFKTIPAFASGGLHTGGMRLVGERGPELEVTGAARYWSYEQTKKMMQGGGNESANEIRALREENRAQARAMVQLQARFTKLLERWDAQGMPDVRVEA